MKKVILGGVAAIVVAVLAVVNVSMNSQNENLLSDLALANVEALAQEEGGGGTVIQCHCQVNSTYNYYCTIYGTSVLCAQSSAGGNVVCGSHNSNCKP
jgi:hypothetical protein